MLRYKLLTCLALLASGLFQSCVDQSIDQPTASEDIISPYTNPDPAAISLRPVSAEDVAALEKDFGISVLQSSETKLNRACRWSDDTEGDKYGIISCKGRCGVVDAGNNRIGIGSFDKDDLIVSSGAYRDRP